jgi:hypothetical protein
MPIEALDHVQLAMPPGGEPEARAFYAAVLGLTEVPKPVHLAKRGGVWFERAGVKVHLGVERDFVPARKAHPAFIVADLRALVRTLQGQGTSRSGTSRSRAMTVFMSAILSATASS